MVLVSISPSKLCFATEYPGTDASRSIISCASAASTDPWLLQCITPSRASHPWRSPFVHLWSGDSFVPELPPSGTARGVGYTLAVWRGSINWDHSVRCEVALARASSCLSALLEARLCLFPCRQRPLRVSTLQGSTQYLLGTVLGHTWKHKVSSCNPPYVVQTCAPYRSLRGPLSEGADGSVCHSLWPVLVFLAVPPVFRHPGFLPFFVPFPTLPPVRFSFGQPHLRLWCRGVSRRGEGENGGHRVQPRRCLSRLSLGHC
jgi:hypothetical protein